MNNHPTTRVRKALDTTTAPGARYGDTPLTDGVVAISTSRDQTTTTIITTAADVVVTTAGGNPARCARDADWWANHIATTVKALPRARTVTTTHRGRIASVTITWGAR